MTEAKFTPGPWLKMHDHPDPETRISLANIRGPIDDYGIRDEIASVYCCDYGDKKQEYNANLIAAAPELYEAAARILSRPVSPATGGRIILEADLAALDAALAKARGES